MKQKKRLASPFRSGIPAEYRERFEEERADTNVSRMLGFSIYIVVLQLVLQVVNMLVPQGSMRFGGGDDGGMLPLVMFYVVLSLTTLITGILYSILLRAAKRGKIKSRKTKTFLVQSLLYIYLIIQFSFGTTNVMSDQGMYSLVILMLMVGMIPVLKPLQSFLTIGGTFLYTLALMFFTKDIALTMTMEIVPHGEFDFSSWITFFDSDMRANYVIITGVTIVISVFVYRLYVSNFLKSIKLEEINAGLEDKVAERTKELEEKTVAAEAASRAKSRFLTNVSHEIRTPLNAISGMAHVAERAEALEKVRDSMEEITKASSHLLGLLNDVLDMSSIEDGKLTIEHERFLLLRAVNEAVSIIDENAREKAITFEKDIDGIAEAAVMGDKLRLKQVLLALLGNAIKYTQEDGHIKLAGKVSAETDTELVVTFSVTDSGIGMTDEQLAKLFVAFEQGETNRMKHTGTGLGLAISQSLVQMMGGEIRATSTRGEGSVFTFSVRLTKAEAEPEQGEIIVPDLTGKHILSVEDIEINRLILTELLAETHATVDEAVDGVDAVEKFRASPEGYYSFVFMDLLMPNMDGHNATRCIRNLDREDSRVVPIVALSANAFNEDVELSIESGMDLHLAKPVDFGEVMRVLTERVR
ncbi:MAG: response regulator [Oscillospiraceae bacterium]|jgi:signal transduction histidine kinase/ActR/RegA family two-component response regulator|nr:response regulator [Oscillospiraceae bacterium]